MPYAVVETIGDADSKKLLAVPESWTVCKNEAIGILYWPNVIDDSKVKEMMLDEHSTPSDLWDKQLCKVIYRSIPSLTSAQKTVEILQKQHKMNVSITVRRAQRSLQQGEDPFGNLALSALSQTAQNKASVEQVYDPFGDPFTVTSRSNKAALAVRVQEEQNNATQNMSSRKTRQPVVGPLENAKHSTQLYDLINELKNIIISNQEEIKQNIRDGFNRMQQTIKTLVEQKNQTESNLSHGMKKAENVSFKLERLKTVQDVKRFNNKLSYCFYMKKLQKYVDSVTRNETKAGKRMKIMFDLIFDTALLPQFDWNGKHGKHPLKYYFNIRNLFEYIGTTPSHRINQTEVSNFFMKITQDKMHVPLSVDGATTIVTAVADGANNNDTILPCLALSGNGATMSVTTETSGAINYDTTLLKTMPSHLLGEDENGNGEQNDTVEECKWIVQDDMILADLKTDLDDSMEHDGNALEEEQTLPQNNSVEVSSENILLETCVNRITCVEELDTFENQLNDVKVKQLVHKWIDKTVGHENDVDKRMIDLLDRLIDKQVLQTFSWMHEKCGKRPLDKYQNFVQLFEYASRTVIHQTVIFNYGYVSNFFIDRMKENEST
uniref:DUF4806 domain-containing protein n=1 Tax=Anopheles minimus TaxID=112268 RepID=A0A182WR44_9DIPT